MSLTQQCHTDLTCARPSRIPYLGSGNSKLSSLPIRCFLSPLGSIPLPYGVLILGTLGDDIDGLV